MDARLCVGNYAAVPYCFEKLNLRVYCAEELCYVLKENAFLLDTDVMEDGLVRWVDAECGLKELAEKLHHLIHKKGSFSMFVSCILEYVGFYDSETVERTVQTLKKGQGLSLYERRKIRIDALAKQKKYQAAIREYEELLEVFRTNAKPEKETASVSAGAEIYASILHNEGVAWCGLMRYDMASEFFREAYETDRGQESLKAYLAAKRMVLGDREYVEFVSAEPEYANAALSLEKEIEAHNTEWEQEIDYDRMNRRVQLKQEDEAGYMDENRHLLEALKEEYRLMTM